MRVGLVACSARKLDRPERAQDLYQGTLFKLSRRWVEQNCEAWGILSTRYGLVLPKAIIAPYEETLNNKTARQREEWSRWIFQQLINAWGGGATYVVLAGANYRRALRGLNVVVPLGLDRLPIGRQVQALQEALR